MRRKCRDIFIRMPVISLFGPASVPIFPSCSYVICFCATGDSVGYLSEAKPENTSEMSCFVCESNFRHRLTVPEFCILYCSNIISKSIASHHSALLLHGECLDTTSLSPILHKSC